MLRDEYGMEDVRTHMIMSSQVLTNLVTISYFISFVNTVYIEALIQRYLKIDDKGVHG